MQHSKKIEVVGEARPQDLERVHRCIDKRQEMERVKSQVDYDLQQNELELITRMQRASLSDCFTINYRKLYKKLGQS